MKKFYLLLVTLLITSVVFGQTDNIRRDATKIKINPEVIMTGKVNPGDVPGKGIGDNDSIGYNYFATNLDVNNMGSVKMGSHIKISGTGYGYVNRIYQDDFFETVGFFGTNFFKINEVMIKFPFIHNISGLNSKMILTINKINLDSSYTKVDTTSFKMFDIDTTNAIYIFQNLTHIPLPNTPLVSQDANTIGINIKLTDVNYKLHQDTAYMWVAISPNFPKLSAFWATDSNTNYIFFYNYFQMVEIFPVADEVVGIMDGNNYINGVQLSQNYPNPSSDGVTTISYAIADPTSVILEVFDYNGKMIEVTDQGVQQAGKYCISLNTKLASGIYYYSLIANGHRLTKKMVIEK
jgi:hypothetical protein